MSLHAVANSSAARCPICKSRADLFGVVDFHKSCLEAQNLKLSLSGIPIYYRRCTDCRFVFTDAFDSWTHEDFARYIYNKDYALIDPDYADKRPDSATFLNLLFGSDKSAIQLVDYGGGNGKMAQGLREKGYSAETFDPFSQYSARPAQKADIVTAYEVMEHSNRPYEILEDMTSLLNPGGIILFSTLLQPADFDRTGLNWWYVAPRNGHVSIYSREALERLFKSKGYAIISAADQIHFAYRGMSRLIENIIEQIMTRHQPPEMPRTEIAGND